MTLLPMVKTYVERMVAVVWCEGESLECALASRRSFLANYLVHLHFGHFKFHISVFKMGAAVRQTCSGIF